MLDVTLRNSALQIGPHFGLSFQRTLRIPDDGKTYPLPPGLGRFPILRVADFDDRVPEAWRERGGVFIPMYQREALWLSFDCPYWRAVAVQVGIGGIDAITGKRWRGRLNKTRQNYVVCPDQPWLDGINAGDGFIRQFVAMPLGMGYTVEGQLTGKEEWGGIQIRVVEPRPGRFPDAPPRAEGLRFSNFEVMCCEPGAEMGLSAGGRMRQKVYPDPHGWDTWDEENAGRVFVHIANSMTYREITGMEPPPTPISARLYTQYGLPWFDLYDEGLGDVEASEELAGVDSIQEMDFQKAFAPQQDDASVEVPEGQVKKIVPVGAKTWTRRSGSSTEQWRSARPG